ncbi:branched-chain amino acid transport system substrate-binding protein [Chromobacterium alkanivorans]|uniref:branched-chain amino acid ABC transporter substrate-binding protein n=1 Tax=Chromobacterium alkanivorans TaxID=1071719 RepID=UPI001966F14A|nr:branched-chain amino acid ABC transporter substrate-binding protein [Chromobacterium alkanivorans]MBN3003514.1 branched-chain amino acid ABC transporter substrate-binding protein [Chromobacterium alkanivorans]MCS3804272.1 branched-chain amino acid transport system substrate-binding protein [Chromobacterium alkanivorans]MCS3818508.1 branched-chain amino acid transport system substrate-binding protein [Chromobacterium alkanivorans]MCS3873557.1 branched-chain amino acid transport system substra
MKPIIPLRAALAGAALMIGAWPAAAETVVKIGFASPLSGPQAHYGKDNENAARLAVDDLNARKVQVGGQPVRFQLLAEDDQADPRIGTQVAQRFVDSGVKAVLGHFNSGVSIPAARIYAAAGIPQLSVSTNPAYTQQGYRTTFRLVGSDSQVGAALGRFAVQTLKASSIVVIDDRTAYGQGIADEFAKAVQASGGKIARREYTNDKASDFSAILTAVKPLRPQVVFYGGADAQAAPMAKQMKRLGLDAKLLGGDMLQTPTFLSLAGDSANGHFAGIPGGQLNDRPAGKAFRQRYQARFKQDVVLLGPQFYDGMMLVAAAMQQAGSVEPARFMPVLAKLSYTGVSTNFSFNAKGDLNKAAVTISEVKNGQWTTRAVMQ